MLSCATLLCDDACLPARYNPEVSYCQGLNFVAAIMLLHGDEADAFALLSALCDCLMPGYHTPTMAGLHAGQQAFLSMLTEYVPRVARKLLANNVPVREQLTSWLLCCYIDALPLDATLRVRAAPLPRDVWLTSLAIALLLTGC